jgi:SAM-dependent methyltransferase
VTRPDRWDDLAERYAADTSDEIGGPLADAVLELLAIEPGHHVLDLGCGPGNFARRLVQRGCRVTGVDASPALLAVARDRERPDPRGIDYIEANVSTPGLLAGAAFDRALASMSLSDIDDLSGAFANVARLLVDDGCFVFSILHPCFPGHGSSRASWSPAGYHTEGWWLAEGHHGYRGVVGSNHRTLSTYFNSLAAHGFVITTVREPEPEGVHVPMFLVVQARRR